MASNILLERCRERAGRRRAGVQRHGCTWAKINDRRSWRAAAIAVLEDVAAEPRTCRSFPEDRCEDCLRTPRVSVSSLARNCCCAGPRQWVGVLVAFCCVAAADSIVSGPSCWAEPQEHALAKRGERVGIRSWFVLSPIACWRRHANGGPAPRFVSRRALSDLLGEDAVLAEFPSSAVTTDPRAQQAVFDHLWDGVAICLNITTTCALELPATYFEADPPFPGGDSAASLLSAITAGVCADRPLPPASARQALVGTPEMSAAASASPGNTATIRVCEGFLEPIERPIRQARRSLLMDRGVPTEVSQRGARPTRRFAFLVGSRKGRLTRLESNLVAQPVTVPTCRHTMAAVPDRSGLHRECLRA